MAARDGSLEAHGYLGRTCLATCAAYEADVAAPLVCMVSLCAPALVEGVVRVPVSGLYMCIWVRWRMFSLKSGLVKCSTLLGLRRCVV